MLLWFPFHVPFHVPFFPHHFTDIFCSFPLQVSLLCWFLFICLMSLLFPFIVSRCSCNLCLPLCRFMLLLTSHFPFCFRFRFIFLSLFFQLHVVFVSLPHLAVIKTQSGNFLSVSSRDPFIVFYSPFAFSLHFPFFFLSFYLSWPHSLTFVSHWLRPHFELGSHFAERISERKNLKNKSWASCILCRTEARHRNQSMNCVVGYTSDAACLQLICCLYGTSIVDTYCIY